MAKSDLVELEGMVTEVLHGGKFIVDVENDKDIMKITCHLGGKLRKNKIHVLLGDKVRISISPYDVTNGIITWRLP